MMPKLTENCCQIDAQNALKSSLGGTLELNFSSFGTGSRRMETGIWKMDVGIQKMKTEVEIGSWNLEAGVRGARATDPGYICRHVRPACPRSPGGPWAQYINR